MALVTKHPQRPEVVAITGASAGIGRATVAAFAKRGAHIGLIARGAAGLEGARQQVERLGGKAIAIPTDVADADAVEAAADQIEQTYGTIDIWVNVAFTSVFAQFVDITAAEFKRVTEVTYLGYVNATRTALTRFMPRDRGKIVQVGSALGYRSIPLQSAYCGAKHAINGFTDSIRCELIHHKSHVQMTVVQMPAVNTPQFTWVRSRLPHHAQPVPPIFEPEVAGEAVYWAAHHRKRELFVGASTVIAIQGNKIAPWFADWYLGRTGYASQQYDGSRDPNAPDNLFHPVDTERDYGAHGAFDGRSTNRSVEVWAAEHKGLLVASVGAAGALTAIGVNLLLRTRS